MSRAGQYLFALPETAGDVYNEVINYVDSTLRADYTNFKAT
jgi:hypothetical protein